jgi:antitoxin component HigA of HigAB toxin-antitoxin module
MNTAAQPEHGRLLLETQPSVIENEAQNEPYLEQVTDLLHREDSLSPEESRHLKRLTLLIEDFEERHYCVPNSQ